MQGYDLDWGMQSHLWTCEIVFGIFFPFLHTLTALQPICWNPFILFYASFCSSNWMDICIYALIVSPESMTSILWNIAFRKYSKVWIFWKRRSEWTRGLRHVLSSPAQTLGSWVPIPIKAWMSVCVYSVFVLFCVCRQRLCDWLNPGQGVLPTTDSYRLRNWKKRPRPARAVEP
jgi:hypothetical protein